MGFSQSSQGGSSQQATSQTTSTPYYLPGQEAYMQAFLQPLQSMYAGDFSNPTSTAMFNLAKNTATQASAQQKRQIGNTPGLSSPAKAQLVEDASNKAITAAAGIPGQLWQQALQVLQQYALATPQVLQATTSQSTGSGGGGSSFGVGFGSL